MVYQFSTCFQEGLAGPSKRTEAHEWRPRIKSGEQDHLRKEEPVCHIILPLGPLGNWLKNLEIIWLVVDLPLWKIMSSSVGMIIPYILDK